MKNLHSIGARFKHARTNAIDGKLTQQELGDRIGISKAGVSNIENGNTKQPSSETILNAESCTGFSARWILTGKGEELAKKRMPQPQEISLENNPDYPSIRRVSFKASAGISGFEIQHLDKDLPPIVFSKSFYEKRKLNPDKLFAIRVHGDSMEPGLYDEDWVVVNTGSKKPKDGVVYSINYGGEIVIKRLELSAEGWLATSDNPKFKDKKMTEDCFVIGEVIHKQSERI